MFLSLRYLNQASIWLTELKPSGGPEARAKQEKEAKGETEEAAETKVGLSMLGHCFS